MVDQACFHATSSILRHFQLLKNLLNTATERKRNRCRTVPFAEFEFFNSSFVVDSFFLHFPNQPVPELPHHIPGRSPGAPGPQSLGPFGYHMVILKRPYDDLEHMGCYQAAGDQLLPASRSDVEVYQES